MIFNFSDSDDLGIGLDEESGIVILFLVPQIDCNLFKHTNIEHVEWSDFYQVVPF